MTDQIIPFLTASILLTLSPGPDIIYVLVQSISNGKKAGFITSLGLVSGIIIHTSLIAFGVSALISQSESIFTIIKLFGAGYLFFLAFKVYKSKAEFSLASVSEIPRKQLKLFRQGFFMNLLNPKVTIFFLAFFPGFLWAPNGNTVYQFYVLGFLFMIQALIIFGLVSLLAGKIAEFLNRHRYSSIFLKWLQVVVFVGIGILILL